MRKRSARRHTRERGQRFAPAASGYVLKELDGMSMPGAMRRASWGQSLFDDGVRTRIIPLGFPGVGQ